MADDIGARDAKVIQYLNEAYGKEKELETALEAHIALTTRDAYKKRLKDHLKETKAQAKGLERRIKQLGGKAEAVPAAGPGRGGGGCRARPRQQRRRWWRRPRARCMRSAARASPRRCSRTPRPSSSTRPRRSPTTTRSRRWPRPSATARRPSSRASTAARRSGWPSSSDRCRPAIVVRSHQGGRAEARSPAHPSVQRLRWPRSPASWRRPPSARGRRPVELVAALAAAGTSPC